MLGEMEHIGGMAEEANGDVEGDIEEADDSKDIVEDDVRDEVDEAKLDGVNVMEVVINDEGLKDTESLISILTLTFGSAPGSSFLVRVGMGAPRPNNVASNKRFALMNSSL